MTVQMETVIESKQRSQQEYDEEYQLLIQGLIELNSELDTALKELADRSYVPDIFEQDLQAERVEELTLLRDELLVDIMRDPAQAFLKEFDVLEMLYEGRTATDTDSLGTTVHQFVTRDPARQKADLHFRHLEYFNGKTERVVEVPLREEQSAPFFVSLSEDELRLATTVYRRGMNRRVEIDPESDHGKRLLVEFFTHSITASDLMYNRLPHEIIQADDQAKTFLRHKRYAHLY